MATLNSKKKARDLISQFRKHQEAQVRVLEELYGLDAPNVEDAPNGEDSEDDTGPSGRELATQMTVPELPAPRMPPEWSMVWTEELLQERINERQLDPGCGGDQCKKIPEIDRNDPAVRLINDTVLRDLDRFTDRRDPKHFRPDDEDGLAFYVIDCDERNKIKYDTRGVNPRDHLFMERVAEDSFQREIVVRAFTPSALASVLLSAPRDPHHDYAMIYTALRRHLSDGNGDRLFYDSHGFFQDSDKDKSPLQHMGSVTIPYFALSSTEPSNDTAPQVPFGLFGTDNTTAKYIRQEKFTMSYITTEETGFSGRGPSLVLSLNPLFVHDVAAVKPPLSLWLSNNLRHISWKWNEVLDLLDEQTALPSTILFEDRIRQNFLFEDANFSKSKKYFWALQSLRLFEDQIAGTLRLLSGILSAVTTVKERVTDGVRLQREADFQQRKFRELEARIKRKREEIQSLSDGLFAASSVAEARLSLDLNQTIRLLTLVTIVYLPLSYATSIYGMDVLPSGASFASFFVVTAVICALTYGVVFNLQLFTASIRRKLQRSTAKARDAMAADASPKWRERGRALTQLQTKSRTSAPASKWFYTAYLLRWPFIRRDKKKKNVPDGGTGARAGGAV